MAIAHRFGTVLLALPCLLTGAQQKGGEEETGPYQVVANWPRPLAGHEGWTWGSTSGVFAETKDRIFVLQRGELRLPEGVTAGPEAIFGAPGRQATTGKP